MRRCTTTGTIGSLYPFIMSETAQWSFRAHWGGKPNQRDQLNRSPKVIVFYVSNGLLLCVIIFCFFRHLPFVWWGRSAALIAPTASSRLRSPLAVGRHFCRGTTTFPTRRSTMPTRVGWAVVSGFKANMTSNRHERLPNSAPRSLEPKWEPSDFQRALLARRWHRR